MKENVSPSAWILKHRQSLLVLRRQYILVTDRLIAASPRLQEVESIAANLEEPHFIYYVPPSLGKLRVFPLHVKLLKTHSAPLW